MRKSPARRRRSKKIFFGALLLPLLGFALWGLISLVDPWSTKQQVRLVAEDTPPAVGERRKRIYDRSFNILALSFQLNSLYARPLEIADPDYSATELSRLLNLDRERLLESLRSERGFVWLTSRASEEQIELALNLPGVYVIARSHRYYPHHESAAHALGFVRDEQGLAGIELTYDNILRGVVADGLLAAAGVPEKVMATTGVHLVSTLDLALQQDLERRLSLAMKAVDASSAAAVVMAIASGEVLAMASLPTYDPNRFWAVGADQWLNRATLAPIRPGALLGLFGAEAAPEQGVETTLPAAPGAVVSQRQNWQEWAPGIYASSKLAEIPREKARLTATFPHQIKFGLVSDFALGEEYALDLIGVLAAENEVASLSAVSGISLLTAFSRLLGAPEAAKPHLVKGFWDGEQFWPRQVERVTKSFPAATDQAWLRELITMSGDLSPLITFESLVALEPKQDHELLEEPRRYQAVLLGLAPTQKPSLAALVFIDGARLDLALPSPLVEVFKDLDRWSAILGHAPAPPPPGVSAMLENILYRQWFALQEREELPARVTIVRPPEYMPDVLGLSLREALRVLPATGLRLQVRGSGQVVAQHPAPGATLKGADQIVIELRRTGAVTQQ